MLSLAHSIQSHSVTRSPACPASEAAFPGGRGCLCSHLSLPLSAHLILAPDAYDAVMPQVLYPAMRSLMGDLAPDDCLDAHQTLKAQLSQLVSTPVTNPNFDAMLQDFMKVGAGCNAAAGAGGLARWQTCSRANATRMAQLCAPANKVPVPPWRMWDACQPCTAFSPNAACTALPKALGESAAVSLCTALPAVPAGAHAPRGGRAAAPVCCHGGRDARLPHAAGAAV